MSALCDPAGFAPIQTSEICKELPHHLAKAYKQMICETSCGEREPRPPSPCSTSRHSTPNGTDQAHTLRKKLFAKKYLRLQKYFILSKFIGSHQRCKIYGISDWSVIGLLFLQSTQMSACCRPFLRVRPSKNLLFKRGYYVRSILANINAIVRVVYQAS